MTTVQQPGRADEAVVPLSVAVREGSRAEHEAAEGSSFLTDLLEGRINEAGYAAYLLRLRTVYAALEDVGRTHAADPVVAAVLDPALERVAALDADLAHWAPDVDPGRAVASPAAAAYRDRVLASSTWLPAYVAHHYTRYLGDLSGGQAIGRLLDRTFGLDGAGLAFYDFSALGKPKPYKDGYRARLDGLGLDAAATTRVVDEVRAAFALNQALFVELAQLGPSFRR